MMPIQNVQGLVLRPEVVDAIRAGTFHLYPIRTIDEGLEVLTGVKAGSVSEEGTLHWRVQRRLRQLAEGLRHFGAQPPAPPAPSPAPAPPATPVPSK
jgi:Lon-like ATP-dependent protease